MSTTRTHFTFRVDTWTPDGESIVEHVAGIEDYQIALVTYRAACQRWPGIPITLRQSAQVIEDSSRLLVVSSQLRARRSVRQREPRLGRGFKVCSLVSLSDRPLDALISIPKHKSHNGCPKNAGRCPNNHIRAGCPTSSKNCSLNRDVKCLSVGTIFAHGFSERSAH